MQRRCNGQGMQRGCNGQGEGVNVEKVGLSFSSHGQA